MTNSQELDSVAPQGLTTFSQQRFSRKQLALFAGGSGDHNPIHIDSDEAKLRGFDDVIVPGMLLMAQLGQLLTEWAGASGIRRWTVRFISITPVLAQPTYFAEVVEEVVFAGEACLRVNLWGSVQNDEVVLRGEAIIAKKGSAVKSARP